MNTSTATASAKHADSVQRDMAKVSEQLWINDYGVPRLRLWRDTVHPIPSTLHQLRTRGRVSTGPLGRIKAKVLSITSPCHLNLHKIETVKRQQLEQRESLRMVKKEAKGKANHMTLTKALTSACFPPLPSQKHLSCSTSAPGQVWTVSSQNLLDSEVATRLLATHATHTSPSAMPNK